MLTRTGYVLKKSQDQPIDVFELKKTLTVRPIENAVGITPPSFKVFRETKEHICVPRYFGIERFGPARETRPEPARITVKYTGVLRDTTRQNEAFKKGLEAFQTLGGGVLSLAPGFGKCLGKDTPVMMYDGSIKPVQDVKVGDKIMGDDSSPRNILSVCSGTEQLYNVVPTKGDSYIVNESHILSLISNKKGENGKKVDIEVREYLKLSEYEKSRLKGYRVPVDFPEKQVPLDPYMFGYWLGDGSSSDSAICSQDSTVLHYFSRNLGQYNLHLKYSGKYDYRICGPKPNYFFSTMKELNVIKNKHIPAIYKYNSRNVRLQLLAGLLDSDGSAIKGGWEFVQKNEKLFDDFLFLARSLGFYGYKSKCVKKCTNSNNDHEGIYYRCSISGDSIEDVPCKVPRKIHEKPRCQVKNVLRTGIKLEKLEVGEYFGFEIDGNHRFVLGDFTVTHNTQVAIALACHMGLRTIIIVHKEFLAEQWESRIRAFCPGATIGRIQQDKCEVNCDFSIAMIQTLSLREHDLKDFDTFGLAVVDEAHHIGSRAFSQAMFKVCPRFTLGLTATPERKDGLTRLLYWFLGPNFLTVERENQSVVKVVPLHFKDELFKRAPPVNRMGSISVVDIINILVSIPERNELIIKTIREAMQENRKVLFLSDRRGHCFEMEAEFGDVCGLYLGGMKQEDLDESAKKQVILGTFALAQEGLDIPTLDTVVLATPHSDVKQAVGRILRETKGKVNNPVIYDVVDQWSVLMGMYRKRCIMYKEAGFQCDALPATAPSTSAFAFHL
jgi:Hom_end-associated Hint/Type III restriction enzyme, res subunit/LAGLIDADG-like domain